MSYCPECGKDIGDVGYCLDCKPKNESEEKNDTRISKLINWQSIIVGGIVFIALFAVMTIIEEGIYIWWTPIMAGIMIITGIVTSYFSGGKYSSGITNTTIIAIFYSILLGLILGPITFVVTLVIFVIFGIVGSLIGVFIQKIL